MSTYTKLVMIPMDVYHNILGGAQQEIVEEQAGFISEKGTRNQIMNLKLIIEKYREYNTALYICFIDYRKAFDTVSHNKLWQIICNMGFP